MSDEVLNIINTIKDNHTKNQKIIEIIKKKDLSKINGFYFDFEKIINNIPSLDFSNNYKYAGVDAGFVNKQLNYANITIIKEKGVVFDHKDDKLVDTKYFPEIYDFARPYLTTTALELDEVILNTSILRLFKELDLSIDIISKTKDLDFFLIDGSIIPQYLNNISKESKLYNLYKELLTKFFKLYEISKQKNVFLVGCIEDSRSDKFASILNENLFLDLKYNLYDPYLVSSLLEKNQRTCILKYTKDYLKHPILKDFPKEIIDNLYVCYIKLSEFDYPLRIEFIYFKEFNIPINEYVDKIVKGVSKISNYSKSYIYPSVLVEADLRSRLKMDEIDSIIRSILERTRSSQTRLFRRENRLF